MGWGGWSDRAGDICLELLWAGGSQSSDSFFQKGGEWHWRTVKAEQGSLCKGVCLCSTSLAGPQKAGLGADHRPSLVPSGPWKTRPSRAPQACPRVIWIWPGRWPKPLCSPGHTAAHPRQAGAMEKFRTLFQHFQSSSESVMNGICLLLAAVTVKLYSSFDFNCPCLARYNALYGLGLLLTPPLALFLCGLLANRQSVVMVEEWRRPAGQRRKDPGVIRCGPTPPSYQWARSGPPPRRHCQVTPQAR